MLATDASVFCADFESSKYSKDGKNGEVWREYTLTNRKITMVNPLTPTVAIAIKHPVPDRVKPSFVIFDIRAL